MSLKTMPSEHFSQAYDSLREVIYSDNKTYHQYLKNTEKVLILEKLEAYVIVANSLTNKEFNNYKMKKQLVNMWNICHSYLPLLLRFSTKHVTADTVKLTNVLGTYIRGIHLSLDLSESTENLRKLDHTLINIEEFIAKHEQLGSMYGRSTECFENPMEVKRIISSMRSALDSVHNTYVSNITSMVSVQQARMSLV